MQAHKFSSSYPETLDILESEISIFVVLVLAFFNAFKFVCSVHWNVTLLYCELIMVSHFLSATDTFTNRLEIRLKMKNTFNKCFMIPVKQNIDVEYKRSINCTFLIFQPMRN